MGFVRIFGKQIIYSYYTHIDIAHLFFSFLCSLVAVKLLLGTNLVSYASHRYSTMDQREQEEDLNAKDRKPIGVDKEEKVSELLQFRWN